MRERRVSWWGFVFLVLMVLSRGAALGEDIGINSCPQVPLDWRCCMVPPSGSKSNDFATELCKSALQVAEGQTPSLVGMECVDGAGQAASKCPDSSEDCYRCVKKKFEHGICTLMKEPRNWDRPVCDIITPQLDGDRICVTIHIGCKYNCSKP